LGAGEPLVLFWSLRSKEGWSNQFEFVEEYDLIIPDRGHGEYITNEEISSNFARDVISLLRARD
jgi:hypothetical protein